MKDAVNISTPIVLLSLTLNLISRFVRFVVCRNNYMLILKKYNKRAQVSCFMGQFKRHKNRSPWPDLNPRSKLTETNRTRLTSSTWRGNHNIYSIGCWSISHMKKSYKASAKYFQRRILGIPRTEHVRNDEVLEEKETKRILITSTCF